MAKKAKSQKTAPPRCEQAGIIWSRPTSSSSKANLMAKKIERRALNVFQPTPTPVTPPATLRERAVVAKYREFRDKMRNGPYYAVLGRTSRISKPSPFSTLRKGNGAAIVGGISGFSSVHTYTGRYQKHDKTLPVLADVKWSMFAQLNVHWTTDLTSSQ